MIGIRDELLSFRLIFLVLGTLFGIAGILATKLRFRREIESIFIYLSLIYFFCFLMIDFLLTLTIGKPINIIIRH